MHIAVEEKTKKVTLAIMKNIASPIIDNLAVHGFSGTALEAVITINSKTHLERFFGSSTEKQRKIIPALSECTEEEVQEIKGICFSTIENAMASLRNKLLQ